MYVTWANAVHGLSHSFGGMNRVEENLKGEKSLYYYRVNREVKLLVLNHSNEKEEIQYNSNSKPFKMPKIGPRPPYYTNPRYEPYYPKI
jgi:hypothetical protein